MSHPCVPFEPVDGGALVHVRVTPKSSSNAVEGVTWHGDAAYFKVRVTSAPEDGKANEAVAATLAKALGVPASAVTLKKGTKARMKAFHVSAQRAEDLYKRLRALAEG